MKIETPEQREKRLAGYRLSHARQVARLRALRGPNWKAPRPGEEDSPEERERIYREIAELRELKRKGVCP